MNIAVAVRNRHLLTFRYMGAYHTVKPHTYGVDARGEFMLRALEVDGRWRLFHVSEMSDITVQPTRFTGVHPQHRINDKYFVDIIAQLY
ncbi:WYL domain-containing protein [Variovorax terrae]|uniref:WYL domain-containing protein n=1 Tax=Variovorax terrae TaxID=2923278 RepID=A0A9X2AM22_9BURK|nr:WYL domain-containing protein [Variovorax terrae]MCJ0762275.1 WYL domain-containing protein [Variovorax terrae]